MISSTTSENILEEIKLITHPNDISRNLHARIAPDGYCISGVKETINLQNILSNDDKDMKIKNNINNENEKTNINFNDEFNNNNNNNFNNENINNNENSANIPDNVIASTPITTSKLANNKIKSDLQDLCSTLSDPKLGN
jgi:hypothetical protein